MSPSSLSDAPVSSFIQGWLKSWSHQNNPSILCGRNEFSLYIDEVSLYVQINSTVRAISAHDLVIIFEQENLAYLCLAVFVVVSKW